MADGRIRQRHGRGGVLPGLLTKEEIAQQEYEQAAKAKALREAQCLEQRLTCRCRCFATTRRFRCNAAGSAGGLEKVDCGHFTGIPAHKGSYRLSTAGLKSVLTERCASFQLTVRKFFWLIVAFRCTARTTRRENQNDSAEEKTISTAHVDPQYSVNHIVGNGGQQDLAWTQVSDWSTAPLRHLSFVRLVPRLQMLLLTILVDSETSIFTYFELKAPHS